MDLLTHTATGLFLSRAGLSRLTPYAAPMLMLAALAPDIDIVSLAGGQLAYLHYHRHLTHSLAALPAMAILPVILVRLISRKPLPWLRAFGACLIAASSHLLLDYTNLYGVRLLLPFSSDWLRLDLTSIVDLWIWAVFLLALAAPFLSRLVGSEIRSADIRSKTHGRGFAIFALLFLVLYGGGRSVLHARAVAALDSRVYRGAAPVRVAALPDPFSPLRWRGLVETGEFYAVTDLNLAREFDPGRAEIFRKPQAGPALAAAGRAPAIQEFLRFSQYPLWRVSPAPDIDNGWLVNVYDMRFGNPQDPGFVASATLDANFRVVRSAFQFGRVRPF
jgi:inner membrane protein